MSRSLKAGVNTGRGKNRDQYGRKFGKKQADAMVSQFISRSSFLDFVFMDSCYILFTIVKN